MPAHTRDYDLSLLSSRYEQYLNLSSHLLNLTLSLDTTEVRDHSFGVRVCLSWPNLVIPSSLLQFPLTQVGNTTYKEISLTNPGSRYPLVVQITMENYYPMADGIMEGIPERSVWFEYIYMYILLWHYLSFIAQNSNKIKQN